MTDIPISKAGIVLEEIKKAKNILLHLHPNPDGDSVGSVLSMYHALTNMGKNVVMIKGDSVKPAFLESLPGFNDIREKNFFETDLKDFDLFLILDTASTNQISKKGDVIFPSHLKTICIDHHATNPKFADINIVDPTYPATTQILFDIYKIWDIDITSDMARCLIVGIYFDTGGFMYRNTTSKTFLAAAELSNIAPDFADTLFNVVNSNTPDMLRAQGLLLASIELWFNNSVGVASMSYEDFVKEGMKKEIFGGLEIANMIKSVRGWNIGITMIESDPGVTKLSFRSRDPKLFDVSKTALKVGGGGHPSAAGATIHAPLAEAKEILKKALADSQPNLAGD